MSPIRKIYQPAGHQKELQEWSVQRGQPKITSVSFSLSITSDSLLPRKLQCASLPCPPLSPRVCTNSSIESVMPSNHLILCRPLLLLTSIFPSIRVFSSELALHIRWPKYWSFSTSHPNEYSGLISFRIDWFDKRISAMEWTLVFLIPNFICWSPHPQCNNSVWRWRLWELIRSCGWSPLNGISALIRRDIRVALCSPCEDTAGRQTGRLLTRHQICWCLDLQLCSLQNYEK